MRIWLRISHVSSSSPSQATISGKSLSRRLKSMPFDMHDMPNPFDSM